MNVTIRSLTAADQSFLWEMLHQALYTPPDQTSPREVIDQPDLARYAQDWGFVAIVNQNHGTLILKRDSIPMRKLGWQWLRSG